MSYIVKQYNKSDTEDVSKFMDFIKEGEPIRVQEQSDSGITSIQTSSPFLNEAIKLKDNALEASKSYYFHGKIKRMKNENQVFHIYLINTVKTENTNSYSLVEEQQFLKTIVVQSGNDDWVDIELVFTPFVNFNTILFKLQRDVVDYNILIYVWLSVK